MVVCYVGEDCECGKNVTENEVLTMMVMMMLLYFSFYCYGGGKYHCIILATIGYDVILELLMVMKTAVVMRAV